MRAADPPGVGASVPAVVELGSQPPDERWHRNAARGAGGGLVLAVVVGAGGWWNPWHLTYLGLGFTWPYLCLLVLAGVGILWHAFVRRWPMKVAGFIGLALGGVTVVGVAIVESQLDDPLFHRRTANADNDVEVSLVSQQNVWDVWLRAHRGPLSREHLVARIGRGDSAPPAVEARFTAPDELVITSDGVEVYRVRYAPGNLDVEDESCRPYRERMGAAGCMS